MKNLERWAVRGLGISSLTLSRVSRETLKDLEKVHETVEDLILLSERKESRAFPLQRVLEAAVEEVEPGLLAQGVRVERDFSPSLPLVRGEERAIRRALERILLRAGRSPLPDGRILVRARRLEGQKKAEVAVFCGPDRLAGAREEGFVELAYRIIQKYRGHVEEEVRGGGENRITVLFPEASVPSRTSPAPAKGWIVHPQSGP